MFTKITTWSSCSDLWIIVIFFNCLQTDNRISQASVLMCSWLYCNIFMAWKSAVGKIPANNFLKINFLQNWRFHWEDAKSCKSNFKQKRNYVYTTQLTILIVEVLSFEQNTLISIPWKTSHPSHWDEKNFRKPRFTIELKLLTVYDTSGKWIAKLI